LKKAAQMHASRRLTGEAGRMNNTNFGAPPSAGIAPEGGPDAPHADSRCFSRRIDALPHIVAFAAEVFDRRGIDSGLLPSVDFAMEELFTNMVKYGAGSTAPIVIAIASITGGVEVTLTDRDVPPFDPACSPDADVTLPIEQRVPGGLGLHLTRRLVDAIEYEYIAERRESQIRFRKTDPGRATAATVKG
jgi:serine/threonine-protein kinase RsbW